MIKLIGFLFILLTMSVQATAALTDFDRQELAFKNWLAPYNSGFESGKAKWTASGGTLAAVTSGSNLLVGKGSATFDGSSASQTLTSQTITIEKGYYGQNCEAGIVAQVPSGTATHTVQAYDGTNILASVTIISSTTPRLNTVNFPCPQSGTVALRLVTVASDEPSIAIDDAYLGLARNVGSTQLISEWTSFTPTGSWTSNTTYTGKWRRLGDTAEVQIRIALSGAPTAATLTVNLPSGLVIDTSKLAGGTTQVELPNSDGSMRDDASYNGFSKAFYDSTTSVGIRSSSTASAHTMLLVTATTPITWAANDSIDVTFRVPIVGWTAQTTASIDAISKRGSIYFASGSATNTGSVAAFNVAGFGTNTLEGQALAPTTSNDLGIRMTGAPAGTYEVQATGRFYASSAATTGTRTVCNYSLYDGTSTRGDSYGIATGAGSNETNDGVGTLTGQFVLSSAGTINVVVRGQRVTGNGTCYAEGPVSISIKNVSQPSPSIVLANSVSTGTTNGEKIERATIASGCASVTSSSGTWVSSVSKPGTGQCTVSIASGSFSAAPTCVCTVNIERTCRMTAVPTTASFTVDIFNGGSPPIAADSSINVICMGPR